MDRIFAIIITSEKGRIDRGKIPAFTHREDAEEYAKSYKIYNHEFDIVEFCSTEQPSPAISND